MTDCWSTNSQGTDPFKYSSLNKLFITILALLILLPTNAHAYGPRIVGGQAETGYPAVGALMEDGEVSCTGTLITPRVVLTAAHCLTETRNASDLSFFMGPNANQSSSGTSITAAELIPHREFRYDGDMYDIGLIRLAQDADVTPITYNADAMAETWIGERPIFVGYGTTSGDTDVVGLKKSVRIRITEIGNDNFTYSESGANTCSGDSGGPAIAEINGVPKILGVTSWGDEYCEEFGVNTRTDTYTDFITCVLEGGDDCGGTIEGGGGNNHGDDDWGTGDDDDFPDDWCTPGDGYCDEPCETPDPDCDADSDDDWNGPDSDDDSNDSDPDDDSNDSGPNESNESNESDTSTGDNPGTGSDSSGSDNSPNDTTGESNDHGQAPQNGGSRIDTNDSAGGCTAGHSKQGFPLWALLLGLGWIHRRRANQESA